MQDFKRYLGTCIYLQIVCSYQQDVLGMSADISRLPYYAYSNRDEWVDPSAYIDYVINHIVKQWVSYIFGVCRRSVCWETLSSYPNESTADGELAHAHELIELIAHGPAEREYIVISSDEDEEPIAIIDQRQKDRDRHKRTAAIVRVTAAIRRKQKEREIIEISSDDEDAAPMRLRPVDARTTIKRKASGVLGRSKRTKKFYFSSEDDNCEGEITAVE